MAGYGFASNPPYKLVFRWDSGRGEAKDLYLDDHSYD
jgi:proteic killer suppression protein